jgi:exosome complex component CSL4
MSKKNSDNLSHKYVIPGDKIAVIEEFLPDETCFEDEGSIISRVSGEVRPDLKKHKISVIPAKKFFELRKGDIGIGRVEYTKKQIASVNIHYINDKEVPLPVNSILHVSEASRRFIRNMYDVARSGDWLKFRIVRDFKPIYISLIGEGLGVILAYCNHCGTELENFRRNSFKCSYCEHIQDRIISKAYGKPIPSLKRPSKNETRR